MPTPFDVAWLVNGDEPTAPGPPARIIEEVAVAGAAPKNTKTTRTRSRAPKDNPLSLMGWFIAVVVPLLSAAFVSWMDAKNPKFWKKLKPKHKGILLMLIAAGAHFLEHKAGEKVPGKKAGDYDKEQAQAMHDLGVTSTALAARYFFDASMAKKAGKQPTDPDRKPDGSPQGHIDGQRVQQMVEHQLRQVVADVMRQGDQPVAGFNMANQPGLNDDLFDPGLMHALEQLGDMAA